MLDVIKGEAEALDQIRALVKEAESLGIANEKSLAISLETIEFLPAVTLIDHRREQADLLGRAITIFSTDFDRAAAQDVPRV